jgi:hypothetical protein
MGGGSSSPARVAKSAAMPESPPDDEKATTRLPGRAPHTAISFSVSSKTPAQEARASRSAAISYPAPTPSDRPKDRSHPIALKEAVTPEGAIWSGPQAAFVDEAGGKIQRTL